MLLSNKSENIDDKKPFISCTKVGSHKWITDAFLRV